MSQNTLIKKTSWGLFAFFAIGVGLYPVVYFLTSAKVGILNGKEAELLQDSIWNTAFYGHISFGGIALLLGWSQFSQRLRAKRIGLHRNLGKGYLATVFLSAVCAIYLSFFAMGGWIASTGFFGLGMVWFTSTLFAYLHIRNRKIAQHRNMMIYSYAACFAAVTLRLWMPFLQAITGDFITAYRIVAWLSWVPNMLVAYVLVRRASRKEIEPLAVTRV